MLAAFGLIMYEIDHWKTTLRVSGRSRADGGN
jgi:hypothetical protein